ncbi:MAG: glycogen synthase GlgA [Holophagales bacterium]|nr:glycogen synthase GlgA [Holophagales bacterium]
MASQEKSNVCFVAAEVAPFAKTGGLADVSAALPTHLKQAGHDVRVFMPLYSKIRFEESPAPVDFLHHVPIPLGDQVLHFSVFTTPLPGTEVDVYFIGCPPLYDREGIYTGDWDDHLRFAFLSHAALRCCQHMGWAPDVVHANDWHAALLPLYLRTCYAWDRRLFSRTRSVLTIHNIAYQGRFPASVVGNLGLDPWRYELHQDHLREGYVSFLETGVLHADVVSTVSRTYAQEIQTPAFGNGLDGLLRQRSASVVGIVNGVDYSVWSPEHDPYIPARYGPDDVAEGKAECKRFLLEQLELPPAPSAPVLGIVSRLTSQKGFEITFEALTQALRFLDLRLTVLGSGERSVEERFQWLHRTFPEKVCFYRGYNEELAHLIEAGADIFLMPSLFEPCGLNQMYSLRYGTVPIVRRTGGLADTVQLFDPATGDGTGVVFDSFDSKGFAWALRTALDLYRDTETWRRLRANAMAQDFSWERQGARYEALYRSLVESAP